MLLLAASDVLLAAPIVLFPAPLVIDLVADVTFFAADDMFACACADSPEAIDANTSPTARIVNTATIGVVLVVVIIFGLSIVNNKYIRPLFNSYIYRSHYI